MTRILAFFVAFLLVTAVQAQTPQTPAKSLPAQAAIIAAVPTQQILVTQQVVTYPIYATAVVAEPQGFYKMKVKLKFRGSTRCCGY